MSVGARVLKNCGRIVLLALSMPGIETMNFSIYLPPRPRSSPQPRPVLQYVQILSLPCSYFLESLSQIEKLLRECQINKIVFDIVNPKHTFTAVVFQIKRRFI